MGERRWPGKASSISDIKLRPKIVWRYLVQEFQAGGAGASLSMPVCPRLTQEAGVGQSVGGELGSEVSGVMEH